MARILSWARLVLVGYAVAASAADSVQLFIDNMDPNAQWAASVANACNGSTTYVVSQTSAPGGGSGEKATITEGPNFYQATTPAVYSETSATMHESCAINSAESSALCVVTVVAANYNTGDAISKTISYNLTGTGYYQYDVKITAGASHTANGGSCVAKSNTANSSISARGSREVLLTAFVILAGVGGVLWM
ncbi:hypothetical protein SMMN14_09461 [Sphaerulina musiva]